MIFQERQLDSGYSYDVEDVFGTVHIDSDIKLSGELLDDIVVLLLKQNISAEEIRGEVKHNKGVVQYVFKKRPTWEDDEPCEDTPTSTLEPGNESILTQLLKTPLLSWCARFAGAFREAWKKSGVRKKDNQ